MYRRLIMTLATAILATGIASAVDPPRFAKRFDLPSGKSFAIPGDTVAVVFTISNPNTTPLTGALFIDNLPAGLLIASSPAPFNGCGGTIIAPPGSNTIIFAGGVIPGFNPQTQLGACTIVVYVSVINPLPAIVGPPPTLPVFANNSAGPVVTNEAPASNVATATLTVSYPVLDRYFSNLNAGDSFINITNAGTDNTAGGALTNICANVFAFSPDEQLISCCACPVTPNALVSLSVVSDLISNTLTPAHPTSVVVKVAATTGTTCNASNIPLANLAVGLEAWGATPHRLPAQSEVVSYGITETPFARAALSLAELNRLTSFCGFIQSNGSGFGICRSCRLGGLGANKN